MITTYGWLSEYVPLENHAPDEVADILTMVGLSVESAEELPDGDVQFELEVTFNRPDLLGMVGVARELAAAIDEPLALPPFELGVEPGEPLEVPVAIEAEDGCSRYSALIVEGVEVGPSPDWLVARLEAVGQASVNNVVDATNFVLWELGQPLHAFDLDELAGPEIGVRRAREGETIQTIQHREVDLDPADLVIADAEGPVAIAGVVGGAASEVHAGTSRILIESARFEPVGVRRTVRRHGIRTPSSHRFERGVDFNGVGRAAYRVASLIVEAAGGTVRGGLIEEVAGGPERRLVDLRFDRLDRIAGVEIPRDGTIQALKRLGFLVVDEDTFSVRVAVPSWRHGDVTREIDVIEEVIRLYGYERIPLAETFGTARAPRARRARVEEKVREILCGAGLHEAHTLSFQAPADDRDPPLWTDRPALRVREPVRSEVPCLRRSLLGGLLEAKATNQDRGVEEVDLFEASSVYLPNAEGEAPTEKSLVGILADRDYLEVKGLVELLLDELRVDGLRVEESADPFFAPGWGARFELDGELLGFCGKVGADPCRARDLDTTPCAAEVDLELLARRATLETTWTPPSPYPPIERHVACVVPAETPWQAMADAVHEANPAPDLLEEVRFLDAYAGEQIGEGKKSVAFALRFRAPDRTLEAEEVDGPEEEIVEALAEELGAVRRAS